MANKSFFKNIIKVLIVVICVTYFFACKNTDTYLKSKYFKENSSSIILQNNLSSINNNTTELAKTVNPAIVAILAKNGNNTSIGSGVCVKSGGYILTNYHVIEDAKDITLYFSNNKTGSAIVLWSDEIMDIAILKSSVAIPYLPMGDNDLINVGEDVIAVGTPLSLNFTHTFTKGIVSAVNRTIKINTNSGEALMQNLIQHDASINPGNSGGPLINNLGYVIGINTLKISSAEGLGFAIPINSVISVVENIYNNYNYKTPFLGVYGYDLALHDNYVDSVNSRDGFYVESVAVGSPAEMAGLKEGDVIIYLNDETIKNALDFRKELYKNNVDDTISLKVLRNGETINIKIKLESSKEEFIANSEIN